MTTIKPSKNILPKSSSVGQGISRPLTPQQQQSPYVNSNAYLPRVAKSSPKLPIKRTGTAERKKSTASVRKGKRLPALPATIVDVILKLADAHTFERSHFFVLRTIGKGWRTVVDALYIPFCGITPASSWYPFIEDQVPEAVLARSKGKCFKLDEDSQLFEEMCGCGHNPFPTRELKMWCNSVSSGLPLKSLRNSFLSVGSHLWSFTYVVGTTMDSIKLLYDALKVMPNLEDLRVVDVNSTGIRNQLNKYKSQGRDINFPRLAMSRYSSGTALAGSSSPRLTSLSVTGCNDSGILDELMKAYGRKDSRLECLELEGGAVRNSKFFSNKNARFIFEAFVPFLTKLKICGGDEYSLDVFTRDYWNLTHITFTRKVTGPRSPGSFPSIQSIWKWLSNYRETLVELHLYLGYIGEPNLPFQKLYDRGLSSVTKISLPFQMAELDSWNIRGRCSNLEKLIFHDWAKSFSIRNATTQADYHSLTKKEKCEIGIAVKRYWEYIKSLKKIVVLYGKSRDKVVFSDSRSSTIGFRSSYF